MTLYSISIYNFLYIFTILNLILNVALPHTVLVCMYVNVLIVFLSRYTPKKATAVTETCWCK